MKRNSVEKEVRGELIRLLHEQIDALEQQTFVGLTDTELREYDERQSRIGALYETLGSFKAAA